MRARARGGRVDAAGCMLAEGKGPGQNHRDAKNRICGRGWSRKGLPGCKNRRFERIVETYGKGTRMSAYLTKKSP